MKAGLVGSGGRITYNLYTPHEGAFIISSYGATIGSEASSGNLGLGMFGALNVEPKGSRIYRGQVTEEELRLAATDPATGLPRTVPSNCTAGQTPGRDCNPGGQPIIDYEAKYPDIEPWRTEGKAGLPILNMLTATRELVHSDINANIVGSNPDGTFLSDTYPLEREWDGSVFPWPRASYRISFLSFGNLSHSNRSSLSSLAILAINPCPQRKASPWPVTRTLNSNPLIRMSTPSRDSLLSCPPQETRQTGGLCSRKE